MQLRQLLGIWLQVDARDCTQQYGARTQRPHSRRLQTLPVLITRATAFFGSVGRYRRIADSPPLGDIKAATLRGFRNSNDCFSIPRTRATDQSGSRTNLEPAFRRVGTALVSRRL